ncbi:hypothetical protein ACWD3Z_42815 [Streptomyces sp. NPDC002740]
MSEQSWVNEPAVESGTESAEPNVEGADDAELPEPMEFDLSSLELELEQEQTESALEVEVEEELEEGLEEEYEEALEEEREGIEETEETEGAEGAEGIESDAEAKANAEAGAGGEVGAGGREAELPYPFALLKGIDVEFGFKVDEKGLTFSAGVSVEVVEGGKVGVEAEMPLTPPVHPKG